MFCEKCGGRLEPDGGFCPSCGTPYAAETAPDTPAAPPVQPPQAPPPVRPQAQPPVQPAPAAPPPVPEGAKQAKKENKPKKKRRGLKAILILVFVLLLAGGGAAFYFFGLPQLLPIPVDLTSRFSVSVTGFNGHATAAVTLGIDEKLTDSVIKASDGRLTIVHEDDLNALFASIECTASKTEALKNGDEITFAYSYDEALAKELDITLKLADAPYAVESLPELSAYDPFEGLEVKFSGYNYYGKAEIRNEMGAFGDYITYEISKDGELTNGDTVTVTAVFDADKALEQGFSISDPQKAFEVSGLTELDDAVVFSGLSLRFSGKSPKILAAVQNTSQDALLSGIEYTLSESENLSEGNAITVTAVLPKRNAAATASRTFTKECTVELSADNVAAGIADVLYLEDLMAVDTEHYIGEYSEDSFIGRIGTKLGNVDHVGTEYAHGLEIYLDRYDHPWNRASPWVWNEYDIPSGYTRLKGTLTLLERSENTRTFDTTFKILGDGEELFSVVLRPGFAPGEIDIDISGVSKLTISAADNIEAAYETSFLLADARLE